MNRYKIANDPRWQQIASMEDVLAVIAGIEECNQFIATHSLRFNVVNPVENFFAIRRETDTLQKLTEILRRYYISERRKLEAKINGDY